LLAFIGIGMIFGCPTASDKILKSRKKVLIMGTVVYTIAWAIIWMTARQINSIETYMAINFVFGFFGGFFVASFAQIKELFPITIAGDEHRGSQHISLRRRGHPAAGLWSDADLKVPGVLQGHMAVHADMHGYRNVGSLPVKGEGTSLKARVRACTERDDGIVEIAL
jgi:hypothetical protein